MALISTSSCSRRRLPCRLWQTRSPAQLVGAESTPSASSTFGKPGTTTAGRPANAATPATTHAR
ncbi:hypothetical protein M8494_09075 [Serratia ureilytica]